MSKRGVAAFELGHEDLHAEYKPVLGVWDRISLAWWAEDDREHERSPLFTADRATLVVVWPTCARGRLLVDQVEQAQLRWWTPNERAYARLAELHRLFPLGRHDIVLRLDRMRPHNVSGLYAIQQSREPRHRALLAGLDESRRRMLESD